MYYSVYELLYVDGTFCDYFLEVLSTQLKAFLFAHSVHEATRL